jgi:SAM-dependent methyltransferase
MDLPDHFSTRVSNYIKFRPHYPVEILTLLTSDCQLNANHNVADIGSGTGILSELFLQNGNPVFGVEPDPDMRAGAKLYLKRYNSFTSIDGSAEATTLSDHSVDFVVAGQAFHWFRIKAAQIEFMRILIPHGWVVLVWNIQKPSGTPFQDALQEFWQDRRFWKPSKRQSICQAERAQAYRLDPGLFKSELLDPFFGELGYREAILENPLPCNLDGLIGRVLSNGTALEPADKNYGLMLRRLEEIFQSYQVDGRVIIEHDTRLVYGRLSLTD